MTYCLLSHSDVVYNKTHIVHNVIPKGKTKCKNMQTFLRNSNFLCKRENIKNPFLSFNNMVFSSSSSLFAQAAQVYEAS